jgi:hypothetical protein
MEKREEEVKESIRTIVLNLEHNQNEIADTNLRRIR